MMRSFRMCAVIVLVSAAMLTTACGKKKVETPAPAPAPPPPPPPTTPPAPPAPAPPPPAPAPAAPTEDELFAKMTLDELNAKGVLADVFFAFDSVEIGPDARGVLQKNTDYLKRRASTKVLVEGHADSRGTNEYNLALGERRAGARARLCRQPRRSRRSGHGREQGRRAAGLQGRKRGLLGEEPSRALHLHGEVEVQGVQGSGSRGMV